MIKQIQIFTICIVVIVIILSQFSFNDTRDISQTNYNSVNETSFSNSALDSKYAEPVREVLGIVDGTKNSINKVKMEVNKLKKFLDIEQNIKDLNNLMEP